jgi:hypothetical protein
MKYEDGDGRAAARSFEPPARRAAGRYCVTDSPVLMPVGPAGPVCARF